MTERFFTVTKTEAILTPHDTLEDAKRLEDQAPELIAGIIRIVVENGKIKHCHEVGSVDP